MIHRNSRQYPNRFFTIGAEDRQRSRRCGEETPLSDEYDVSKMSDRRVRLRRNSNLRVWADPGGVLPVIDCRILNMTEDGAQVIGPHGAPLPDHFLLQMDSCRLVGEAEVVWRRDDVVGVRFVKAEALEQA